jgi:hypothetical protein
MLTPRYESRVNRPAELFAGLSVSRGMTHDLGFVLRTFLTHRWFSLVIVARSASASTSTSTAEPYLFTVD